MKQHYLACSPRLSLLFLFPTAVFLLGKLFDPMDVGCQQRDSEMRKAFHCNGVSRGWCPYD